MTQAHADLFSRFEAPRIFAPRPYQIEARDAACDVLLTGRTTLIVLPTGTGKTALAGMLAARFKAAGGRTLFLAPTITLVEQTYKALRTMGLGLECGIEQAENYVSRPLPDVTVGSVATMKGDRLRRFDRESFALVIVDEAHRAPGGTAYREILSHFASAKVVGLSATPDRADGLAMGNIFESVAYEMRMLDAIKAGWLAPLEFRTVATKWDPKQIKELAGDVNAGSVEKELVRSGLLSEAAGTLAELGRGRKVLAFLPTVASAKGFAVELSARGLTSSHIDGETPPMMRQSIFRDFRAGKLDVLTNCMVLTEGFDEPDVSVVALLSPTKARGRITQMIGRGTRTAPGKANCLILDFCPGRLKKGRLASPADALAGRMLDDDAYQALSDGGDLAEELAKAEENAAKAREQRETRERKAKERREKLAQYRKDVQERGYSYKQEQHTAEELLALHGQEDAEEAFRRSRGLCTMKQAAVLRKKGLNPNMTRHLARIAMDAIASNGWQVPDSIRDDKRFHPAVSV